jgi:hypothetical protein
MMKKLFLISLSLLVSGCGGNAPVEEGFACAAVVYPAVTVQFFEGMTSTPANVLASGTLADGSYSETLNPPPNNTNLVTSVSGGYGRVGTYNVTVSASRTPTAPVQQFAFSNVVVTKDPNDRCGYTKTVFLRANIN